MNYNRFTPLDSELSNWWKSLFYIMDCNQAIAFNQIEIIDGTPIVIG